MSEEKRPNFPDKYHLSRKESVYLLKKNIVELVYNAGKFEGLNTTLLQTEEIIKYNRTNNVALDDVLTIVNLKRGFEMLLNDAQKPLLEKSKRFNRVIAAEIGDQYDNLMDQNISETEKALRFFLLITKNQIYGEDNQRTALLSANRIMIRNGTGLLSIPESLFEEFNKRLSMYYNSRQTTAELEISAFMYDYCIFGINYSQKI
ncbi:hypothetical protein [Enterococcus faecium]|uniref:hypothetical protein n=1 Tax=Enterococcus faecium TaxID=1352 RepID=UPI002073A3EB|nr:hypothetical protein [Enterococcus faecium]MCM6854998.1 hypothetical protein [Enterococcus faecium]MCM6867374.1 hypothetical protein [Enterococcus faecium]MCM6882225.1 hypothetical protein [Enterococcus faecium]MCM6900535.1 hypothetical protein [Enterococcus faecium]MCM6906241.1 hypothetical protein [Enterococcus faecium]